MTAAPPTVGDVVLGILAVVAGCVGAAAAIRSGHRTGNWFSYVSALGCTAFVAGIAGQRSFPSATSVEQLGEAVAGTATPGPWDAGVSIPLLPLRLTPVSVGGLLVAAIGLSLLLLFERVPDPARLVERPLRRLEDDDSV